ncbi:hypothetical protein MBRA1_003276 [Malassezia brasiliensis]|uniref:Nuclear rim protein 1 n=1 Tax=Malassezia brasiliensis TaxID=1821822 RepID=A0AAF0IQY6_9BASI|nr:hypothetical protein MBRA1_003276 [Malassezia brasiliensis]
MGRANGARRIPQDASPWALNRPPFRSAHANILATPPRAASPERSSVRPASERPTAVPTPHTPHTPLQRKGAYASPARPYARTAEQPTERAPAPPASAWPWTLDGREWLFQISNTFQSGWQTLEMELEQAIYSPELGVPMAIALHALSLLSQVMLPGSSFALPFVSSTYAPSSQRRGKTRLFSQNRRSDDRKSYSAHLGRLLAAQRMAAQRYAVRETLIQSRVLSLALIAVAVYNAYLLFHRRRTYRLWYREEKVCYVLTQDVLSNPHASLEEPPTDPPAPRSWSELARLYSPAHALWWAMAGSLGLGAWTTWLLTAALMSAFSLQTYYLGVQYAALVRDRQVLSAEVLREYDEKVCGWLMQFVFPRAMPLVREASTMTDVHSADFD